MLRAGRGEEEPVALPASSGSSLPALGLPHEVALPEGQTCTLRSKGAQEEPAGPGAERRAQKNLRLVSLS